VTRSTGAIQDRRAYWRLPTFLPCVLRLGEDSYSAFLLELSSNGAFLSSVCNPQRGCPVSISLEIPESGKKISLAGHVIRGTRGTSTHGEICRFAVRFNRVTPDSLQLIKTLSDQAEARTPVKQERGKQRVDGSRSRNP